MINVVKLVEHQCEIGKIYITDSIKNYCNKSIDCTQAGTIEFDVTRGINTTAKGLMSTYNFNSYKRMQNLESLLAEVEVEFQKKVPSFVIKDSYNVRKSSSKVKSTSSHSHSGMNSVSDITFSEF